MITTMAKSKEYQLAYRAKSKAAKGKTDYIFTPSNSDETAKKVSNAHNIKMSSGTITLKDEAGKTRGMIRGITRFQDMPARDQVEVQRAIKSAGGLKEGVKSSDIFVHNKQMYVLNNMYTQRIQNITGENKNKNAILKQLEKAGFIVINYDKR